MSRPNLFRTFFTAANRTTKSSPFGPSFLSFPVQIKQANVMSTPVLAAAAAGISALAYYTLRASPSDKPAFGSGFNVRSLKLHSTEQINHNTKKLRFELPDPSLVSGMTVSSALLTVSFPNGRWLPVLRPYTPTNDLDEPGYVDLMVKLYPGGKASSHLHSLQPGDSVTFAGPIPEHKWTTNQHEHVALIAGGAGITPMYQLARRILKDPEEKTRVTLVWGVNSDADIFLGKEFAEFEQKYPGRFKAVYVVSQPEAGSTHRKGYVNKTVLEEVGLAASDEKNRDIKVLVCGPPAMEKALKDKKTGVLAELGYKPNQVIGF
ncbi:hypothetical protein QBC35DRAFT_382680 [Podospora australis]|uniref:NADH-cytochrome b5 reductase 2 n=1 Tax=Podospora australis TaxID=1536484 RepID=A0AAN6WUM7_9PEZI|nr:hypothetical protein QBC35DRAFT_382680 [Podospora australis]